MKLVIAKSAMKVLRSVQPKLSVSLLNALQAVALEPFGNHPNAKRLKGGDDEFRLRHGDWRVIYKLDRTTDTMTVTVIDTRGGIYK